MTPVKHALSNVEGAAKVPKSPSFPLCQRGMKGGFLNFFASWRDQFFAVVLFNSSEVTN